jgi:hypothetical protein
MGLYYAQAESVSPAANRLGGSMSQVDYMSELGVEVVVKHGITRVVGRGISVHFGGENPESLKSAINEAMNTAIAHFREKNAGLFLTESQLCEVSIKVVLHHLFIYSQWRRTNEKYKNLELKITPDDLTHVQSNDEVYDYCKAKFGSNHGEVAAALMGKTLNELKNYEVGRERFSNR